MFLNNTNGDLRSIKTERALYSAMFTLLKSQNFKKTTVKEICEKALISRAAFYAHFIDKYDLLKRWMVEIWSKNFKRHKNYEQVEQAVNCNMDEKRRMLKNLIYDADDETIAILFDFILSTKKLTVEKNPDKKIFHKNVVLSNFYAGGIISYLNWQIKNEFPADVPLMNREIYNIILDFQTKISETGDN